MTQADIVDRLLDYLRNAFPNDRVTLDPDTELLGEWFVDSLGIIETVMFIEKEFGIAVGRADITGENFRDVAALSVFVASRLS